MSADDEPASSGPATALLIEQCLQGDERAYYDLYKQHHGQVCRHLRLLLGPGPDLEDAVQHTFAQAFRKLHQFEGRSKFSTWLHGIGVRVAINFVRTRQRRKAALNRLLQSSQPEPSSTPEAQVAASQQLTHLDKHLAAVPADRQIPFVLYFCAQLELGEVAAQIGASPGATWKRIKRAREAVIKSMRRERSGRSS